MASTIIPTLRYRNARAMIAWLCDTFGFERHAVHEGDDGTIVHAELVRGHGMIMLGDARDDAFGALQAPPTGKGPVSQSPYLVVEDIEHLYEAAQAAGATIVMDLRDQSYGSREFSCQDPEGQLWNFGTYNPWKTGE
ncbi:glyoxalase [Aurantimonas aggregata]|uniref:Glyoxalase n=1 Tax=Aurantimonas aggregata TaxID=2047720 RepID=A0A6L9MFT3_9HYPH|nr:VOC family protein [Aurantimonas aggregata]NDV86452.1 glyoxalase [Aurantimonas aggregata]